MWSDVWLLRGGPGSLVLWLFMASGCWGQPKVTLHHFAKDVCPRHGVDIVRFNGTLDLTNADPTVLYNIDLHVGTKQRTVFDDIARNCYASSPMSCIETFNGSSIYELVYEAPADKSSSEVIVTVYVVQFDRKQEWQGVVFKNVPYPVVKESIKEVLTVDGVVVPLPSDSDTAVSEAVAGVIAVSYKVTGVSPSKLSRVHILDSSYKVLKHSSRSSQVSKDVDTGQANQTSIFVSYNTTNGCYSGPTGQFKVILTVKEPPEDVICGDNCVLGIIVGATQIVLIAGCLCCLRGVRRNQPISEPVATNRLQSQSQPIDFRASRNQSTSEPVATNRLSQTQI